MQYLTCEERTRMLRYSYLSGLNAPADMAAMHRFRKMVALAGKFTTEAKLLGEK